MYSSHANISACPVCQKHIDCIHQRVCVCAGSLSALDLVHDPILIVALKMLASRGGREQRGNIKGSSRTPGAPVSQLASTYIEFAAARSHAAFFSGVDNATWSDRISWPEAQPGCRKLCQGLAGSFITVGCLPAIISRCHETYAVRSVLRVSFPCGVRCCGWRMKYVTPNAGRRKGTFIRNCAAFFDFFRFFPSLGARSLLEAACGAGSCVIAPGQARTVTASVIQFGVQRICEDSRTRLGVWRQRLSRRVLLVFGLLFLPAKSIPTKDRDSRSALVRLKPAPQRAQRRY